jgi:hypothetical protein
MMAFSTPDVVNIGTLCEAICSHKISVPAQRIRGSHSDLRFVDKADGTEMVTRRIVER